MVVENIPLFLKIVFLYYVLKAALVTAARAFDRIQSRRVNKFIGDVVLSGALFFAIYSFWKALTLISGLSFFFSYLMFALTVWIIILDDQKKPGWLDLLGILLFSISYGFFNLYLLMPI
jgi:hypothetical protein